MESKKVFFITHVGKDTILPFLSFWLLGSFCKLLSSPPDVFLWQSDSHKAGEGWRKHVNETCLDVAGS